MSRIRELSADEETRRLAFVRERALRDEVSFLKSVLRDPAPSHFMASCCIMNDLLAH